MTRFVLFDLDNTLFDRSAAFESWAAAFAESRGLGRSAVAMLCEADEDGFASRDAVFSAAHARLNLADSTETLIAEYRRDDIGFVHPDPSTLGALEQLRARGIRVGVITNGPSTQHEKIERLVFCRCWTACASRRNSGRKSRTIESSTRQSAAVAVRSSRSKPDGWSATRPPMTSPGDMGLASRPCGFPAAAPGPSPGFAQNSLRRAPPTLSTKSSGAQTLRTEVGHAVAPPGSDSQPPRWAGEVPARERSSDVSAATDVRPSCLPPLWMPRPLELSWHNPESGPDAVDARRRVDARHRDRPAPESPHLQGAGTGPILGPHDTAHLREKYAANGPMQGRLDEIVEVDYALNGRSISETVRDDAPFSMVASHVIEHIPDPVGWMIDIGSILRLGGILSLVIPDKRYCFDVNRTLTGPGDLVDTYLAGRTQPTYRDIYNLHSQIVTMEGYVDTAGLWAGTADYENVVRGDVSDPDVEAFRIATYAARSEDYVDVHCHTFTPTSFRAIVGVLSRFGLIDFDVVFELPTQLNTLEFFVSLEKVRTTAQSRNDVPIDSTSVIGSAR